MTKKYRLPLGEEYKLPSDIKELKYKIGDTAMAYGLGVGRDDVIFEVVGFEMMNFLAARGGFGVRYPHWLWGMEEDILARKFRYGLHAIYEIVINSNPAYAYLLETNPPAVRKMVMAHVFGHADFFRNNMYFALIDNRNIVDDMANHAVKIQRIIEKQGQVKVYHWIEKLHSFINVVDIHSLAIKRHSEEDKLEADEEEEEKPRKFLQGSGYKDYMDDFINPPPTLEAENKIIEEEKKRKKEIKIGKKIPAEPERDILQFFIDYAPLENWQREIIEIIRKETYYFAPQAQTKIMNEGWATYWHEKIMTGGDLGNVYEDKDIGPILTDKEIIDYADYHSGTLAQSDLRINPYKLGLELFKHIEERWNKGQFGDAWTECLERGNMKEIEKFDRKLGWGRKKILEVRKLYCDLTFIEEFFTEDFFAGTNFFRYGYNEKSNYYEIKSRNFNSVKRTLLVNLTNLGQPFIQVEDGNFGNKGELLCLHRHAGIDLKYNYMIEVLKRTYDVWGRPVHLRTRFDKKNTVLSYNGDKIEEH